MNKPNITPAASVIPPLPTADTQSANVIDANLAQLKTLFPDAFKEGGIDFEVLKQLLGDQVDEREEKYGLNWHGKRRARQIALTPSTGTLRPCPGESVDWDTTQNLMIEGDNLEVLKLLQKSYAGKVKMIYIDPPYNTGKDFVYPDNFTDNIKNYLELTGQLDAEGRKLSSNTEASGRFHTDWLNMMYPRLKLAKNLLREDGLLFVSIDDNEAEHMKVILNDLFGEENFLAQIMWQKMYSGKADAAHFGRFHEYIFCYGKNSELANIRLLPRTEAMDARYSNPDADPRGRWLSNDLTAAGERSAGHYEVKSPFGKSFDSPEGKHWLYSQSTMIELIQENRIYFGKNGDAFPRLKRFLTEVQQGRRVNTIWPHEEVGHTDEGTKEVKKYFPSGIEFQAPKPTRLLKQVLSISVEPNAGDIVLDFFAGSGTTADAVMQSNAEIDGNTRYVTVQLPEPIANSDFVHIADFTKERLRRAATKIRAARASKPGASGQLSLENEVQAPPQPLDLGFKVFKLDTSNIRAWNPNPDELADTLMAHTEHLAAGRTEADVLYEVLLKQGLDLAIPIASRVIAGHTVHSVGAGALLVCLAQHASASAASSNPATDALNAMRQSTVTAANAEALALGIANWHTQLAAALGQTPAELPTRVVLRDSLFADDVAKTNVCAILAQRGLDDVRSL